MSDLTIHPRTRAHVDSAVRKLGPERALDALAAFDGNEDDNDWESCVFARAYGVRGELERVAELRFPWDAAAGFRASMEVFGLSAREVHAVVRCYDDDEPGRGYLRTALLREASKMVPREEPVPSLAMRRSPNGESDG